MVEITFLGTGGVFGVPVWNCNCAVCRSKDPKDRRLRSSVLIEIGDKRIVIDFGPDLRAQLLKYKIRRLDRAFLTHAHDDHRAGYADLAPQRNLILQAPKPVIREFMRRLGSSRSWLHARNPTLEIKAFEKQAISNFSVDTVRLQHKKDYQKRSMPCFGYVFRSKKFSFAYVTDYSEVMEPGKLEGLDLIISDGNGMKNIRRGHVGIDGSIGMYKKLRPKRMVLTHIKHEKSHKYMTDYVKRFGNIAIAYDGMKIKG